MSLKNVCYGCLSTERKLTPIEEHAKLYRQLLLKKTYTYNNTQKLFMCWECRAVLNNIHAFRVKITHAQSLLRNKVLTHQNSLSSLTTSTHTDIYDLIIQEDEILTVTQPKLTIDVKKEKEEPSDNDSKKIEVEFNINIKEELKHEDGVLDDNILETADDVKVNFDDINTKDDISDRNDDISDVDDKLDEALVPVEFLEKKEQIQVKQGRKKRGVLKKKYRTIIMEESQDKRHLYDVINIDQKDAAMELKKRAEKRKDFRCALCYSGFAQQKYFDRHMKQMHNQKNKYVCDVCGLRFPTLSAVRKHMPKHFHRFRCKLCEQEFNGRNKMYDHLKRGPHTKWLECKKCGRRFDCTKRKEFFDHYRDMHEYVICDHCGLRRTSKKTLAVHIKARHTAIQTQAGEFQCKQCNRAFRKHDCLKKHIERKHVTDPSERNYCVECDIQFMNNAIYNEHVKKSVKHRPSVKRVKCLECDKTYVKHCYMMNHYNLVHLQNTKYVCPICERHFLNTFRLRCHVKYYHEKMPKPRHNICNHCGRGFTTRRILENHVRTHTGERPYACALCPAAFAQMTPLKTHERSVHALHK